MNYTLAPAEYLLDTLSLRKRIEFSFLELAARLTKIKNEEMWKGKYDSYQEFLAEMRISESTDSKLRAVHRRFVIEYGLAEEKLAQIGYSSLYEVASKVEDKETALALVEKASHLRIAELRDEIRRSGTEEHECEGEEVSFVICSVCKRWTRKYNTPPNAL